MNSLFFLFTSLIVVSGSSFHKFMTKYATVKVLSSCLGEEFMSEWHTNYTKTVQECYHMDPETYMRLMYTTAMPQPSPVPMSIPNVLLQNGQDGFMRDGQGPGLVDLTDFVNALQGPGMGQPVLIVPIPPGVLQQNSEQPQQELRSSPFWLRRSKRAVMRTDHQPEFDEEKIDKIYKSVLLKASNFTCVVHKMNLFNYNYEVNLETFFKHLEALPLDPQLKVDIMEGVEDCIEFTRCKPEKKMTFIPVTVQKAAAFLKCEMKQRLSSCVKNDLMNKQHKFDMDALGEVGNTGDMDEGDKMFALIYGEMMGGKRH